MSISRRETNVFSPLIKGTIISPQIEGKGEKKKHLKDEINEDFK